MRSGMTMKFPPFLAIWFLAACVVIAPGASANAQRRIDQQQMIDQLREGRILPLREIERQVLPRMTGARYIGFDFDVATGIYTLKFLRKGNVVWVEVDGRTAQILSQAG